MGISADDYAKYGDGPLEFTFSLQHQVTKIHHHTRTSVHKTLRKPGEIISDLAKAIGKIIKDYGNKSISYMLDADAREALSGDPKIGKLLGELVMIMGTIKLMKDRSKPSTDYIIESSERGKPVVHHDEHLDVRYEMVQIEFKITIGPPKA